MKKFFLLEGPAVLLLLIAVLVIFSPYIFGHQMVVDEEHLGVYYPSFFFYTDAVRHHQNFLWDPHYYGGFPTYLTGFSGDFYPLHYLLARVLPFFAAYFVSMTFAAFIGLLASYAFGRVWDFSRIGSILLAFTYMTGFTVSGLTTVISYANGFMVLPLLFLFITLLAKTKSWFWRCIWAICGGISLGAGFLAGYPQFVLYALTFSGVYLLFIAWQNEGSIFKRFQAVYFFIAIVIIGGLWGSQQLFPTLKFIPLTIRTSHYVQDNADGISLLPQFVSMLLPSSFHLPPYVSGIPGLYVGTFAIIFAFAGLFFFRSRAVIFFSTSWLIIATLALNIPGISWFSANLPIFSQISNPTRWLVTGSFSLAWLAAFGYERIKESDLAFYMRGSVRLFQKITFGVLGLFVLGFITLGVGMALLLNHELLRDRLLVRLLSGRSLSFPYEHYREVFRTMIEGILQDFAPTHVTFWIAAVLIVAPAGLLLLAKKRTRWFSGAVLCLSLMNLFYVSYMDERAVTASQRILSIKPAVVSAIEIQGDDPKQFRIASFLTGEALFREVQSKKNLTAAEVAVYHWELLTNQIGEFFDLETMFGFEPFRTLRMNQLLDTVIAPHTTAVFVPEAVQRGGRLDQRINIDVTRPATVEEKTKDFISHLPLLSMMNVKYILSVYPIKTPELKEVVLSKNSLSIPVHLYENSSVFPRVYFTQHPVFWQGSERDLLLEVAQTRDFQTKTFIECTCQEMSASGLAGKSSVTINTYKNGFLKVSVENENSGWLVFSESNLPGWIAIIDGQPTTIYTANYLFQSIQVPAGIHDIIFSYLSSYQP